MKNTDTLKKNYEFKYRLEKGKCYPGKCFNIYIMKNKISQNKIGIAVGKKVGKAVVRNKIKRWIREAYTSLENDLVETYDFVFVWKKSQNVENTDYEMVYNTMKETFKKANIIKREEK